MFDQKNVVDRAAAHVEVLEKTPAVDPDAGGASEDFQHILGAPTEYTPPCDLGRALCYEAEAGADHLKVKSVILTTPGKIDIWISASTENALTLRRPLPDGALMVVVCDNLTPNVKAASLNAPQRPGMAPKAGRL